MPKFDSANDAKRPLTLECRGGPFPSMRVYEKQPAPIVPLREETGGRGPDGALPLVGQYELDGSVYVWKPAR